MYFKAYGLTQAIVHDPAVIWYILNPKFYTVKEAKI